MNYAIYARYSSHAQDAGFSIEAQLEACHSHALKQGWTLHKEYIDRALSGKSDDRAAFQEMINDATNIEPRPFDVVIVHKTDRFARNRYDSVRYKHILKLRDIRVLSVTQPMIGGSDPTEILLESLLKGMDEFYSVNLARETLKGMMQNAKMGFWSGGRAPFGYCLQEVSYEGKHKKKLFINPVESVIVKQFFEIYLKGNIGIKALVNKICEMGYKTREGFNFTRNVVWQILSNEKYCGDFIFGKNQKNKNRHHIKFEPIRVSNCFPAIIPRDMWEKIQIILKERSPEIAPPRKTASSYLLAGLMTCKCGAKYVGVSAKSGKHFYYRCGANNRSGKSVCNSPLIPMEKINNRVITVLNDIILKPENIKKNCFVFLDALSEQVEKSIENQKEIKKSIADKEKRINHLIAAIEEGKAISLDDLAPRIHALKGEIESLRLQELELNNKIIQIRNIQKHDLSNAIKGTVKELLSDDVAYKDNRFISKIIERIEMDVGTGEFITFYKLPTPEFAQTRNKLPDSGTNANYLQSNFQLLREMTFSYKSAI